MLSNTPTVFADIQRQTAKPPRITYTELARGKAWREQLPELGIIGIDDKGAVAAWLVSDAYLETMLNLMEQLLQEQEEQQIQTMLDARERYQNWLEGEDLAAAAAASFMARKKRMKAAFNDDIR